MTINQAAHVTGWSPRMLRYIERTGLVTPVRSGSGYRLYGASELVRLHELRELLARFDLGLTEVAFAARLAADPDMKQGLQSWLDLQPERPAFLSTPAWAPSEPDRASCWPLPTRDQPTPN
jgi:MerR family transcriptional regulator, copper efflux regulator